MEENRNVLQTLTKDVMKEEIYVENEFLKKGIRKLKKLCMLLMRFLKPQRCQNKIDIFLSLS